MAELHTVCPGLLDANSVSPMHVSTGKFPTININGGAYMSGGVTISLSHDVGSALTRQMLLRRGEESGLDCVGSVDNF